MNLLPNARRALNFLHLLPRHRWVFSNLVGVLWESILSCHIVSTLSVACCKWRDGHTWSEKTRLQFYLTTITAQEGQAGSSCQVLILLFLHVTCKASRLPLWFEWGPLDNIIRPNHLCRYIMFQYSNNLCLQELHPGRWNNWIWDADRTDPNLRIYFSKHNSFIFISKYLEVMFFKRSNECFIFCGFCCSIFSSANTYCRILWKQCQ